MKQPTTVSLPLFSHVLIEAESLLGSNWSLPSLPTTLFSELPTCLLDRHTTIRKRMIEAWRDPIAQRLRERLEGKMNGGLTVLEQRMNAWKLALSVSGCTSHCQSLSAVMTSLAGELFDAKRIEPMLMRVFASVARSIRNYTTMRWVDHEYQRLIVRLAANPNSILKGLVRYFDLRSKVMRAINEDAAAFGLRIVFSPKDQNGHTFSSTAKPHAFSMAIPN